MEKLLIDPKEAVRIGAKVGCTEQIRAAAEIEKVCKKDPFISCCDAETAHLFMLQVIFNAGRVYGIREERKNKRGEKDVREV